MAAVASVFFSIKRLFNKQNVYFTITLLLFYGMVLFIYLFTYDGYSWFQVSFNRIWLSIYPVTVFMLGCIVPRVRLGIVGEA